jgi:type IV pilus assembly protein PilM
MKLPGLQRYLAQNLDQKVIVPDEFTGLVGGSVTDAAPFKDNRLTFGDAYGLCVQALGLAQLRTNLLPTEITTSRLIKAKKPWTVAAAALLMLGLMGSYAAYFSAWKSADVTEPQMQQAMSQASNVVSQATNFEGEHSTLVSKFDELLGYRRNLLSNVDGRLLWLELMKAIDAALPKSQLDKPLDELTATDVSNMNELHIERLECEYMPNVGVWYAGAERVYKESIGLVVDDKPATVITDPVTGEAIASDAVADATAAEAADGAEPEASDDTVAADDAGTGEEMVDDNFVDESMAEGSDFAEEGEQAPTGAGWVIEISGHHFHNSNPNDPDNKIARDDEAAQFVRKTLIKNLEDGTVTLPSSDGTPKEYTMDELGIKYPILITRNLPRAVTYYPEAETVEEATALLNAWQQSQETGTGMPGGFGMPNFGQPTGTVGRDENAPTEPPKEWKLRRYDFTVQFLWVPKPRRVRDNPELATAEADTGGGF